MGVDHHKTVGQEIMAAPDIQNGCRMPPLLLSRSDRSTRGNKTGDWRFVVPRYENKTAPCAAACPVGQDIPRIEMLAARGDFMGAWNTIMAENPFPAVCGRVCFHPCEAACNRSAFDQPVAVHHIERSLGEWALKEGSMPAMPQQPASGMRIAIAGGGPAGLTAAYFLTGLGYECHVYEAREEAGGVLRWGIPAYRLPLPLLAGEVSRLARMGIRIYCKRPLPADAVDALGRDYQAIFVACGHGKPVDPAISGREFFIDGLGYLSRARSGTAEKIQGDAVVIGGGNTAVDVARTLVRSGAKPVIVYRRRMGDMPAFQKEIDQARAEGVLIRELSAPVALQPVEGGFEVELQAMALTGEAAEDGRARVTPAAGATETMRVRAVFAATGAEPDVAWLPAPANGKGRLSMSHCLMKADGRIPVVYGGDLASPVLSVPNAIMSGKQAAMAIDVYLQEGFENIAARLGQCPSANGAGVSMAAYRGQETGTNAPRLVPFEAIKTHCFDRADRQSPARLSLNRRMHSFDPVEASLGRDAAIKEARRCFNCGTCNGCGYCSVFCPELAVVLGETNTIDLDYCKGCGICVEECPRNAMSLETEGE